MEKASRKHAELPQLFKEKLISEVSQKELLWHAAQLFSY